MVPKFSKSKITTQNTIKSQTIIQSINYKYELTTHLQKKIKKIERKHTFLSLQLLLQAASIFLPSSVFNPPVVLLWLRWRRLTVLVVGGPPSSTSLSPLRVECADFVLFIYLLLLKPLQSVLYEKEISFVSEGYMGKFRCHVVTNH